MSRGGSVKTNDQRRIEALSVLEAISEEPGQGDAREWWKKAYDQLGGMKARGIMLPTDEKYLETLRQKANA